MTDLHFGFAVIAYGTALDIRETLESIGAQDINENTKVSVMVAYHDESITEESVRDALGSEQQTIKLIKIEPHDDINVMRCTALPTIASALPDNIDWVWTLEDGHQLYSRNSVHQLANTIREMSHANVHLIHACDAARSFDTGYGQIKRVTELCDMFGYFEMLGRQSLMVMRSAHFQFAYGEHLLNVASKARDGEALVTPHTQAQFLYLALSESDGLLVDLKLTDLEPGKYPAHPTGIGEWFTITHELIELNHSLDGQQKWTPHFFRYGECSLWTELVLRQGLLANTFGADTSNDCPEVAGFIENWQTILELADHVDNEEVVNIIYEVVTSGIKLTLDFLNSDDKDAGRLREFFAEQADAARTYPSTLFRADYLMLLLKQSA